MNKKKFESAVQDQIKSIVKKKNSFMTFSYTKKLDLEYIKFGKHSISLTDKAKILGICIDNHLTLKDYTSPTSSNISKTLLIFYKLSEFFPAKTLKSMYDSLVLPHIMYGVAINFGAPDHILERINILQKKMIRSTNALPYNTHTRSFFNSLNVLKVNVIHFLSVSTR